MPEFDKYANQYKELLHDPIRERFAPGSGFFFERKWELLADFARRSGWQLDRMTWLDVGCGKGELLRLGAPHVKRTAGCDVSEGMLDGCEGLNVVAQPDPSRLPFPDAHFDLVTAVCVYHHVPPADRHALTVEIARVLKPGGTACIIEHNPFNPATQWIVRRTPVDADAQLLRAATARAVLAGAGLSPIHTTYFLYVPEKRYKKLHGVEALLSWVPAGGQYAAFGRKSA
jgi:SAM-dependent methyltransferase